MKSKRAKSDVIRIHAVNLPATSTDHLDRLEGAMAGPIDTSDIPVMKSMKRHGPIWTAIVNEMMRQGLTGHRLWKKAREYCPRIPESAVYEFMKDRRSVRVEYADAMLQALNLKLTSARHKRAG